MELNDIQFISGFNSGYLLAKYEPKLLDSILKNIQTVNSYLTGLNLGQKEFEMEKATNEITKLRDSKSLDRNLKEL